MGGHPPRLGDRRDELDAARFVGRRDLLDPIEADLAGDAGVVLFVHGPGGMGKSALLREISRASQRHGRRVWQVDGRLLLPSVEALLAGVDGAAADPRPVILVDSFEQIEALAQTLRDSVLPAMPAAAVVVIAGRRPPQPLWFRDGWEHLLREVALRPLDDDEADELLARHGVAGDRARLTRIWGQGSPLALHVGAVGGLGDGPASAEGESLARTIAHRLLAEEATHVDPAVMEVAAVARAVDGRVLASVLAGRNAGRTGMESLQALTVVESYGSRLALHDVVRAALRTELRRRDPDLYRSLTTRLADHLHDRIVGGESYLLDELADLLQVPQMRWSVGGGFGGRFRVDRPMPGDAELAAEALGATGAAWWAGVERYFTEAPSWVTVVRDTDASMAGFSIAVTPRNLPPWTVTEDPVLGPWVEHARQHHPHGNVVVWRDSYDLVAARGGEPTAEVNAILNLPTHLRDVLPHVRVLYGVVEAGDDLRHAISERVGATHLVELDVSDGGRDLQVHALDQGPGGLVGALRAMVHREQGLPLTASVSRARGLAVRDALRRFHDTAALAASSLAVGVGERERAESVRTLLSNGIERAFGSADPAARDLLQRAYLDPDGGHQRAMSTALLSRSSYFRRLGDAVDRLTEVIDLA